MASPNMVYSPTQILGPGVYRAALEIFLDYDHTTGDTARVCGKGGAQLYNVTGWWGSEITAPDGLHETGNCYTRSYVDNTWMKTVEPWWRDSFTIGNVKKTHSNQTKKYTLYLNVGGAGLVQVTAGVTIPAKSSYKITYNANGGSGAPSAQTKWYGETLKLSTTKPKRAGYAFAGWSTSKNGSVVYAAGGKYTANEKKTLYAVWTSSSYTVSYNANGGEGAPASQTKQQDADLKLSTTEPTKENCTFKGWATSKTGKVKYKPGGTYKANASVTLYAVWQADSYTVTYDANGGSDAPEAQTKTPGTDLTLTSSVPTRTDYLFKGWSDSSDGPVKWLAGGTYSADADVTMYAVWAPDAVVTIEDFTVTQSGNSAVVSARVKLVTSISGNRLSLGMIMTDMSGNATSIIPYALQSTNDVTISQTVTPANIDTKNYEFTITAADSYSTVVEKRRIHAEAGNRITSWTENVYIVGFNTEGWKAENCSGMIEGGRKVLFDRTSGITDAGIGIPMQMDAGKTYEIFYGANYMNENNVVKVSFFNSSFGYISSTDRNLQPGDRFTVPSGATWGVLILGVICPDGIPQHREYACIVVRPARDQENTSIAWMLETGTLGLDMPNQKYYSRIQMRIAYEGSLKVEIAYDNADYQTVRESQSDYLHSLTVPIKVKRCDHFRIRLSGVGQAKLYSIGYETANGGNRCLI